MTHKEKTCLFEWCFMQFLTKNIGRSYMMVSVNGRCRAQMHICTNLRKTHTSLSRITVLLQVTGKLSLMQNNNIWTIPGSVSLILAEAFSQLVNLIFSLVLPMYPYCWFWPSKNLAFYPSLFAEDIKKSITMNGRYVDVNIKKGHWKKESKLSSKRKMRCIIQQWLFTSVDS